MADSYLRWKYDCDVNCKPTSPEPPSPLPTADRAAEADAPLPTKSTNNNPDPNHTSTDDTLPNTLTTHTFSGDVTANNTPADSTPTDNTPTADPSANGAVTTPAGSNSVPSHSSGNTGCCATGDTPPFHGVETEITVIDIYTLSTSIKVSSADEETTASALVKLGFIGNAPFRPSVAVSMKTLELYRTLRRRKPSFSIEAFVKVISDVYLVRLSLVTASYHF